MVNTLFRKSICLVLVGAFHTAVVVRSQTSSAEPILKPARQGLVSLHWPDLTKLEEGVREQVTSFQDSLISKVKDPTVSDTALSEAYGELGEIYHAYSLTAPARDCYLNSSVLAPKDFRWIYLLGRLDQQDGRFDDAIRHYQAARTLRPNYTPVLVNLGHVYLEQNRL